MQGFSERSGFTSARHRPWLGSGLCLLAAILVWNQQKNAQGPVTNRTSTLQLDIVDDGKQLKLLVRHRELGPVCELMCYEGGPFYYGIASKREDGSVVFLHTSGKMTATTTFTPAVDGRIWMDILVEGPEQALKEVKFMGPCMQFWHSENFKRQGSLVEFIRRCFLYTVRGPVGLLDTARGPMKSFKADAPENNPSYTQWYVPIERFHPGDIWAFGASGDRPVEGIVAVESEDGRWLAAIGCAYTRTLGQGWHDCIHHVPDMQKYFDRNDAKLRHRSALYVMPNDKVRLLEAFHRDFSNERSEIKASPTDGGQLRVQAPSRNLPAIDLALGLADQSGSRSVEWEVSPWGGLVRRGSSWQMWAWPHDDVLDFWVSLAQGLQSTAVKAALVGKGWQPAASPEGVPALLWQNPSDTGSAALFWEHSQPGQPASGLAGLGPHHDEVSVRGRLYLMQGMESVRERWLKSEEEWQHSLPYRMPLEIAAGSADIDGVRFVPNAEDQMNYGLTILPPWKDGGTLHVNFPEHFEYGEAGHGILRYSDKRSNPWKLAPDGHSASYEVESLELPGVMVQASAVAQHNRARFTFRIFNGGLTRLERIKPLLCFWYAKLNGFPDKLSDNFQNTYVVQAGRLLNLRGIPTDNPEATAKVTYVRGCSQHDCDAFALRRGGLIKEDVDQALIAVTDKTGARKVVISFTPGKSVLSNAAIPCAHADPYLGTLGPGESAEASGILVFSERPLSEIMAEMK
ncbi:MAG: hypothetical protein AB1898_14860 [Acidobacteriota bacterium]